MTRTSVIQAGPLGIPLFWLIFAASALVGAATVIFAVRKGEAARSRTWDSGINALLVYFAVWKISPILTSTATIVRSPLALLYLPGGLIGILSGAAAAALFLAVSISRTAAEIRRRVVLGLGTWTAVILLACGVAWFVLPEIPKTPGGAPLVTGSEVGDRAPLLELADIAGVITVLPGRVPIVGDASSSTQVTFINFWATWCPPCRAEIPEIDRFVRELAASSPRPARLYAVDLASTEQAPVGVTTPEVVERFLHDLGAGALLPHVLLDFDGRAARDYGVGSVPTTVVIVGNRIVEVHRGVVTASWLEKMAGSGR